MKENLFNISDDERLRVLNLHETATKKQYLNLPEKNEPTFEEEFPNGFTILGDNLNPKKVREKYEKKYGRPFMVSRVEGRLIVKPV